MPRRKEATPLSGLLDAKAVVKLLGASCDLALVLDEHGVIIEVLSQYPELAELGARSWVQRAWASTVTIESRQKVEALLHDAQAPGGQAGRWRQINHPVKDADDLPVLYTATQLPTAGETGQPLRYVAFGRDLRENMALQRRLIESQQAMERDYARYREAETRYRHLFETNPEAVLIVDGATQKVVEANPAAKELCGGRRLKLVGVNLPSLFGPGDAEALQNLLAAARSVGRQAEMRARLAGEGEEVSVSASVFRQNDASFVLLRLTLPQQGLQAARLRSVGQPARSSESGAANLLQAYMRHAADGLVFTDASGQVLAANRAFASMAQLSAEEQLRGQPLDRWVGRTGVELGVLVATLNQRGSVGLFSTLLRGEFGGTVEVEISATVMQMGSESVLSFSVRDVGRRAKPELKPAALAMPRSAAELTELVGRAPLSSIVAETTDLIEQLCIQTALGMTQDNRASAALLLGLSRQSLYVKLRRYGMIGGPGTGTDDVE